MINQHFEMKNSKHLLWFFGGLMIGTASGLAAAGNPETSKTLERLRMETSRLDRHLKARAYKLKKSVSSGSAGFADVVRKNLSHPIPDLYKATENFTIGQPETIYEW